jgi:hypothetical protein
VLVTSENLTFETSRRKLSSDHKKNVAPVAAASAGKAQIPLTAEIVGQSPLADYHVLNFLPRP